ncbi:unnamed protein product [Acanthoscelides obtectus]|uniref:Uncharacterized protein n=1 Tax=Acanthoscelides obtectus TaxID=200917 RepID=A0A9P0PCL7_ACAOB|nr:unnamed protein product [Acanthoscelides obtectus]CAK1667575.1 hypothetical protein AOBTE_LOCUS25922 [Acanthoscelides obtectus]
MVATLAIAQNQPIYRLSARALQMARSPDGRLQQFPEAACQSRSQHRRSAHGRCRPYGSEARFHQAFKVFVFNVASV